MKLLIRSQTSTIQPLEFGKDWKVSKMGPYWQFDGIDYKIEMKRGLIKTEQIVWNFEWCRNFYGAHFHRKCMV